VAVNPYESPPELAHEPDDGSPDDAPSSLQRVVSEAQSLARWIGVLMLVTGFSGGFLVVTVAAYTPWSLPERAVSTMLGCWLIVLTVLGASVRYASRRFERQGNVRSTTEFLNAVTWLIRGLNLILLLILIYAVLLAAVLLTGALT
jgi:hypothetical protein